MKLEGKGRLTRRLTASRAIHKKAYKGSLKNVYSSFKGLSALMTKGYNRSNLNYTNLAIAQICALKGAWKYILKKWVV